MKNRREFLALMKGFGIGAAAALAGIRAAPPAYDPIHVPNDRMPVVTSGWADTGSTSSSTVTTTTLRHSALYASTVESAYQWVTFTASDGSSTRITRKSYERMSPGWIDGFIKGRHDAVWPTETT